MISIVMLVHNAKNFTKHSIKTLKKTVGEQEYELIVVDNDSNRATKNALLSLQKKGMIEKLLFLKENTFFAKGNNIGSKLCSDKSDYILLLNSDVEIRNKKWLDILVKHHKKGATAYGVCENNPYTRGDGYCFLIDKDLYLKYQLDESFEWWWSVTKLQAQLLKDGYTVTAIKNHNELLYHYGGMSGKAWKKSKGLSVEGEEIKKWFENKSVIILEDVDFDKTDKVYYKYNYTNTVIQFKKAFQKMKENLKVQIKKVLKK